jgi:hypothetical protein
MVPKRLGLMTDAYEGARQKSKSQHGYGLHCSTVNSSSLPNIHSNTTVVLSYCVESLLFYQLSQLIGGN